MALRNSEDVSGRTMQAATEVAPRGGELSAVRVPDCCPTCGIVLRPRELAADGYVCGCGHHFPMHADAWIALLADDGSWLERWTDLRSEDVPVWMEPTPYRTTVMQATDRGLNESVRCGGCTIGGRPAWLAVFDFRFIGGTLGVVAGERLARSAEHAAQARMPLVVVTASGGARMQEGPNALVQMAKINGALWALRDAAVPYLAVLSYPTYGGTAASLALVADVNIAEPGAAIGFTGPRVIEQATHEALPADFQTAEYQLRHGQIDMIVARYELRRRLAELIDLFGYGR